MTKISPTRISKNSAPLVCPPDKSVTHRSFLFSLLSSAKSVIRNPLLGQDCLASLEAVRRLGAQVRLDHAVVEITGFGVTNFGLETSKKNPLPIDCQNSGTTMRLLSGLLASQKGYFRLIGDESLSQRPMARVAKPLAEMGALVEPRGKNAKGAATPPVEIGPALAGLRPVELTLEVASAQVKSAILLAGLWCKRAERTSVIEPSKSRDHTERMLRSMGVNVGGKHFDDGRAQAWVQGRCDTSLDPLDLSVGGDPSSAAFWACAAVMQDRPVRIQNMLLNPTRLGFFEVLARMGANLKCTPTSSEGGEGVGELVVEAGGSLKATEVLATEVPTLVDEVPILAIAALWAKGTSVFRGVQELRVKESDRLEAILEFIGSIGGKAWAVGNDLFVEGCAGAPVGPQEPSWTYSTLGDHRLAMAAIVTADVLQREITLDDTDCIKVSYPDFFKHREALK